MREAKMKKNKGYTLVELLVAMVVLVIVLMEVYMVMNSGSKVYEHGSIDVALQTEAQQAILNVTSNAEPLLEECREVSKNADSALKDALHQLDAYGGGLISKDVIEDAANKGYEISCNIMAISNTQESDIKVALDVLGQTPVDVFYIVDSNGALFPEQIARIADLFLEFAEKYGKKVGIHAHNNQQMAFANTVEAVGDGVDWLDGTYSGMGRGAGNCAMELLLGFLRNPKYNLYPAIRFVESQMKKLIEEGTVWGYDLQYLITGMMNQHPRTAIQFTKENRKDYSEFYKEVATQI